MKTKRIFFIGIFLIAALSICSCASSHKERSTKLSGSWIMTVTENKNQESFSNTELKQDTTFNSLFNGLKYIPNNSEWNFINDSVLIVSKINDCAYKPDTVFYKVNDSVDTLIIQSKQTAETYLLKKVNANRIKIDLGEKTLSYYLIKHS